MNVTTEVRWFYQGKVPAQVHRWFHDQPLAPTPLETREDLYLCLPDTVTLGVKLRQGAIELKKRVDDRGMQSLSAQVVGHVETWIKWSFAIDEQQSGNLEQVPDGEWVTVQKSRQQRLYHVDAAQTIRAIASSVQVEQGCYLELAEISIHDQPWFSLGFEAFGQPDRTVRNLALVSHYLTTSPNFPPFQAENSLSYPAWLAVIKKSCEKGLR